MARHLQQRKIDMSKIKSNSKDNSEENVMPEEEAENKDDSEDEITTY